MNSFYKELLSTAESAGLKIISDEHCYKLIAWLYVFGGGREEVAYNTKLRENIFYAQKNLNILGGESPTPETISKIQHYVKEYESNRELRKEIEEFYGLKYYKGA